MPLRKPLRHRRAHKQEEEADFGCDDEQQQDELQQDEQQQEEEDGVGVHTLPTMVRLPKPDGREGWVYSGEVAQHAIAKV